MTPNEQPAPLVFVSHSGDDKERFVIGFAERLRAKGIDAWLDLWEMLPGDSLVDKIWNEGIKNCSAFVIVLSNSSVNSKWVQEELNSAFVKRIEGKVKLIPIRLDGCEIPEPLKHIIWSEISDLGDYDRDFERIVNSIFGQHQKPALGASPSYTQPRALIISDLTPIDSTIFEIACKIAVEQGHCLITQGERIVQDVAQQGISRHQVIETLEILHGWSYVELHRLHGAEIVFPFNITVYGFEKFAETCVPDYGLLTDKVAHCLVQGTHRDSDAIATYLNSPVRIVRHILEEMEQTGYIKIGKLLSGTVFVHSVSPLLRRSLEDRSV
jgi:hypothetical protein